MSATCPKGTVSTKNTPASPKDHITLPLAPPPTPIHFLPTTQPVPWPPLWAHLAPLNKAQPPLFTLLLTLSKPRTFQPLGIQGIPSPGYTTTH